MHKKFAKTWGGQVILKTTQRAEGGELLVIVGKGRGSRRHSSSI